MQKRAQELVEEIAALPPLPKQIYEMGDAASELAKHREHRSTWASSPARIRISCSPVTSATCAATRSMKVSPACRTARRESPSSSGIDGRGCPVPASGGLNQRFESDTALTKAGSPDCGESGTLRRARRTALSASLRIWAPPSASPGHHKVSVLAAMGQALRSSIFTNTEQKGASVSVGEEAGHLLQRASGSGERSGLAILEAVRKVTELNSVAHVRRHLVRAVGPCEPQSSPPSGNSCPKSGARAGRSRPICLDYLPEDNGLVSFSRGVRARGSNRLRNGRCCRTLECGEHDMWFRHSNAAIRRCACGSCARCHAGRVPGSFNHISRVDSQRACGAQGSKSPRRTTSNQK